LDESGFFEKVARYKQVAQEQRDEARDREGKTKDREGKAKDREGRKEKDKERCKEKDKEGLKAKDTEAMKPKEGKSVGVIQSTEEKIGFQTEKRSKKKNRKAKALESEIESRESANTMLQKRKRDRDAIENVDALMIKKGAMKKLKGAVEGAEWSANGGAIVSIDSKAKDQMSKKLNRSPRNTTNANY
jgi:hypothetical protein